MARWICPSCNTVMKVAAGLIGQQKPCASCGVVSEIFEAETAAVFSPPPIQTQGLSVSLATINRIRDDSPTLIKVYRFSAVLTTLAVFLGNIYVYLLTKPLGWPLLQFIPTGVALISLAFFWLLTDFLSDVFRCRRLLEEIAKK